MSKRTIDKEQLKSFEARMLTEESQNVYITTYIVLLCLTGYWFLNTKLLIWQISALILALIFGLMLWSAIELRKEIKALKDNKEVKQ